MWMLTKKTISFLLFLSIAFNLSANDACGVANIDSVTTVPLGIQSDIELSIYTTCDSLINDSIRWQMPKAEFGKNVSNIYNMPYSLTRQTPDWHRLWINTATLSGAFVGTLLVLECLPEDATSWNRAELQDVPLFKRWHNHVIKKGPEWDHDKFYFNYILHPYAGATYFMAARSCGFNFWRSALYGSIISTVGWEFGIEAFMERPSIQDIFVTPIVGSCIGEGFYHIKRWLVDNDYRLFGSPVLGGILAFLVDPVNEFTGLWLGNPTRRIAHERTKGLDGSGFSLTPTITNGYKGFSLGCYF